MGWILLILLLLLLLPIIWILYAPIILHIETDKDLYFIEARPIVRVSFYQPEKGVGVWVRIIPFNWEFQPLSKSKEKQHKEKRQKAEKKQKRKWKPKWSKLRNAIFKAIKEFGFSFQILTFRLNLDTDDYVLNAKLYPVFIMLDSYSNSRHSWHINFEGQNSIVLIVQNRLSRFVWIGIKTIFRII